MSNDPRDQPMDEISWRRIIFDCLPKVGLSRGTSVSWGSMYPNTTNLALGLWDWSLLPVSLASLVWPSKGFQVRIQRHLRICSGVSFACKILDTVPVLNQFWTSVSLARANACCSSGFNMDSFTLRFSASSQWWLTTAHLVTNLRLFLLKSSEELQAHSAKHTAHRWYQQSSLRLHNRAGVLWPGHHHHLMCQALVCPR